MNWKSQFIAMFKTWCIGTYKTKNDTKKRQMNLDIFLNQTLLESIDYLFSFMQIIATMLIDLMLENIIHWKV